ncbi:MAG: hypothetical protein K5930_01805 [Treponemataceae bacterium]|nr:hypothetical protein [Treponemataceae bacterium]
MDHTNGRNRNGRRQWNNSRRNQDRRGKKEVLTKDEIENQEAIRTFKLNTPECPMCGKPITELSTALADKDSGLPVHFDCVLEHLQKNEKLSSDQKIVYIGQGRFGVLVFPQAHDTKNFSIQKIIEWEPHDKKIEWRTEIAGLYSQVK